MKTRVHKHKLIKFFVGTVLGIALSGFTAFYCLFHIGLHIPISALLSPFIALTALSVPLAPALYWATEQDNVQGGHHRRLYFVTGSYTCVTFLGYIYYGVQIGLIPVARSYYLCLLVIIAVPAAFVGGYYFRRALFGETRDSNM